jgi:uncharacterized protein YecE (DUF72 family)
MTGRVRVGVGGWTFEGWRGSFFPAGLKAKDELAHASRRLTAIEINGTFYRTQTPAVFAKWAAETPDDFVFAVKAHRFAAQRKSVEEAREPVQRFVNSGLAELGAKLGPINWQFDPRRAFDADHIDGFLGLLPRELNGRPLRHALEVRHPSFADPRFVELLRKHGHAAVYTDAEDWPSIPDPTADFVYARLQRACEEESCGYAPAELDRWTTAPGHGRRAGAPADLPLFLEPAAPEQPRDVFVFFISGWKAHNPAAAEAMLTRL